MALCLLSKRLAAKHRTLQVVHDLAGAESELCIFLDLSDVQINVRDSHSRVGPVGFAPHGVVVGEPRLGRLDDAPCASLKPHCSEAGHQEGRLESAVLLALTEAVPVQ